VTTVLPHPAPAFDSAPSVSIVKGEFVFLGPGGTGFSMTRDAAVETCRRLTEALAAPPGES
jgi:hypothetical protein